MGHNKLYFAQVTSYQPQPWNEFRLGIRRGRQASVDWEQMHEYRRILLDKDYQRSCKLELMNSVSRVANLAVQLPVIGSSFPDHSKGQQTPLQTFQSNRSAISLQAYFASRKGRVDPMIIKTKHNKHYQPERKWPSQCKIARQVKMDR